MTASKSWADGYVVDTPYFGPLITDLTPAWLSMVSVLHGQPPLDFDRPLTWVDLGCGDGLSACMVAAANPQVEVWGCDFNPAHVERARSFQTRARLTNCSFDEASFEDVAFDDQLGPPSADVIVVNGVYSWVSPANQRHIVEFIRRRLRPGGLAYVMYEVLTGWSSMVPLAQTMQLLADADNRRGVLSFPDIAAAIQQLADAGARYFPLSGPEADRLAETIGANGYYAAHEYLGAHFRPLLFDEVAAALARARCEHVGTIEPTDQLSAFWVVPELRDTVTGISDPTLRTMLRDLATQRQLRRALFRRGLAEATPVRRAAHVDELTVIGVDKEYVGDVKVPVPVGQVGLDDSVYRPLVERLGDGPLSGADIRADLGVSADDAAATLALLVSGGYAVPVLPGGATEITKASARRLNEVLIAENLHGGEHASLIAPAIGGAVGSEYFEMLAIGAIWSGMPAELDPLVDHALAELERQGRWVREQGERVDDPDEARTIVERRIDGALTKGGGVFARLEIC